MTAKRLIGKSSRLFFLNGRGRLSATFKRRRCMGMAAAIFLFAAVVVISRFAGETGWTANRVFFKIRNIEHDVSAFSSPDGRTWTRFPMGFEMSGYHHDTFADWSTLRVALFAAGEGTVVFRKFRYQGLDHGQ